MKRILQQIASQARTNPRAIALSSGEASLSYAELIGDVQAVAASLSELGVKSLGIYLDNGFEWIVLDLAAVAAGIRIVPLPWFFSERQLRHAVEAGGVDFIAHQQGLPRGILGTGARSKLYRRCCLQAIVDTVNGTGGPAPRAGKVSFTSGSTGNPKGIDLDFEFLEHNCNAICSAVSGEAISHHLAILPYATLLENVAGVYVPLMLGKRVHAEASADIGLLPDLRVDPAKLAAAFSRVLPASLILTPQLLELFCLLCERGAIDPACLEFVAVGGARAGEVLLARARAAGIPAYEGYGLTEFGSVAMLNTPRADRPGSVGKPLPGVEVSLRDDGEIVLAARVAITTDNGIRRKNVSVATGDYGAIDRDGFVYVYGRKSNLIVLANGRNVSPEWIETELTTSPLIAQAYVFEDEDSRLAALLFGAASDTAAAALDAEMGRINRGLPPYARLARWHRLRQPFSRDNGMLTANGRLRRMRIKKDLPALLAECEQAVPITNGDFANPSFQEPDRCQP